MDRLVSVLLIVLVLQGSACAEARRERNEKKSAPVADSQKVAGSMGDSETVSAGEALPEPTHDPRSLGNYHLYFALYPEGLSLFLENTQDTNCLIERFPVSGWLEEIAEGLFVKNLGELDSQNVPNLNTEGWLKIGSSDMVSDPVTGNNRPNFCVYESESICSLLVVPTGNFTQDGCPVMKMRLEIYDKDGSCVKSVEFTQDT